VGRRNAGKTSKSENQQRVVSTVPFIRKLPSTSNQGRLGPCFPAPAWRCGGTLQGKRPEASISDQSSHDGILMRGLHYRHRVGVGVRRRMLHTYIVHYSPTLTRVPLIIIRTFHTFPVGTASTQCLAATIKAKGGDRTKKKKTITPKFQMTVDHLYIGHDA
jgi:hypothetical protein